MANVTSNRSDGTIRAEGVAGATLHATESAAMHERADALAAQRRIGEETLHRTSETITQAVQGGSELTQKAVGSVANLMGTGAVPESLGLMQKTMATLVQGSLAANMHAAQELLKLANPAPLMQVQQNLWREYMGIFMKVKSGDQGPH